VATKVVKTAVITVKTNLLNYSPLKLKADKITLEVSQLCAGTTAVSLHTTCKQR